MELVISKTLMDEYNKNKSQLKLLENVRVSLKDKRALEGNFLYSFLNFMINDLNDSYSEINIKNILNDDEIKFDQEIKDMYIAYIKEGEKIVGEVCIANSNKLGNTLVTQQIMAHLTNRIEENPYYLKNNKIKMIVYLTYDINKNINSDKLRTIDVIMRTLKTLGIDTVSMFETTLDYSSYKTMDEMVAEMNVLKRGNKKGISIELSDKGIPNIIFRADKVHGQDSKYYGFYLLGLLALARPELKFKYINNDRDLEMKDGTFDRISRIYKGYFTGSLKEIIIEQSVALAAGDGINKLVYGAPGTGKSFDINKQYSSYNRVTFYPDFDYSQFVGGLFPERNNEGKLDYSFIPGIFTETLIEALNNPEFKYGVIIEEINRANPASVFGDIFQLLDRNISGISEYFIKNKNLSEYIDRKTENKYNFSKNGIRLPGNFDIIATMNPADQGVYTLDAAFKRRWIQEYKPINWEHNQITDKKLEGFNVSWKHLGKTINEFLIENFNIDEDMLLGHFFLKDSDFREGMSPEDKLLGYLWNDVVRYNRSLLFSSEHGTLSEVLNSYAHGKAVFVDELTNRIMSEADE